MLRVVQIYERSRGALYATVIVVGNKKVWILVVLFNTYVGG